MCSIYTLYTCTDTAHLSFHFVDSDWKWLYGSPEPLPQSYWSTTTFAVSTELLYCFSCKKYSMLFQITGLISLVKQGPTNDVITRLSFTVCIVVMIAHQVMSCTALTLGEAQSELNASDDATQHLSTLLYLGAFAGGERLVDDVSDTLLTQHTRQTQVHLICDAMETLSRQYSHSWKFVPYFMYMKQSKNSCAYCNLDHGWEGVNITFVATHGVTDGGNRLSYSPACVALQLDDIVSTEHIVTCSQSLQICLTKYIVWCYLQQSRIRVRYVFNR